MPTENRDAAVLTSLEVRPLRSRNRVSSINPAYLLREVMDPARILIAESSFNLQNFLNFFFSKLQSEARMIIWRLNLEPRIVKSEYHDKKGFGQRMEYDDNNVPTLREPSPKLIIVPTSLSGCRDSRASVIKLYSLLDPASFQPQYGSISISTRCLLKGNFWEAVGPFH